MTTPWVFLRGLGRDSRHWSEFPQRLVDSLPGADIHCLDLPGNGARHGASSPKSVSAMVDFCRDAIAQKGIGPCRLLAISLGGMVAVDWASRFPAEITGCVLINTSLGPFSPFYRRLRPANYPAMARLMLAGGTAEDWESAIAHWTVNRRELEPLLVPQWVRWREQAPIQRENLLRQLWAAARYRAPASPPAIPLLLAVSARDRLVHPDCSRTLARAWQLPLVEHATAGHDLPVDDGPWLATQIARWVEEISST